ncbi:MAG: YigZ family protein [Bacteroidetes bacterium]|nr:MAG: YigZ family protein [Bacteroidota bacterium]
MSDDYFKTLEGPSQEEFKDRGSRFMAFAFPIADAPEFKTELNRLKKLHPKAAHHCFAYRLGTLGHNFRAVDDGEPSGSAGRPILGQIDSLGITNAAVVVVRYFGGTLLGVPGLIHAYKTAAAWALQTAPVGLKAIELPYAIECNYAQLNEVMTVLKAANCSIANIEQGLFCHLRCGLPKSHASHVLHKLSCLSGVGAVPA